MDIKKEPNRNIQSGYTVGPFDDIPLSTTDVEDDNLFTGVKPCDNANGDGSNLTNKQQDFELLKSRIEKSNPNIKVVLKDGVIILTPGNSEEKQMFDYKAKINYILSRLAEKGLPGGDAEEAASVFDPKGTLMELLGMNKADMSPEMLDVIFSQLKEKLPEFDSKKLCKVLEAIDVYTRQVEVNATAAEGIINEANKSLNVDKNFFENLQLSVKNVANEAMRSTINQTTDLLTRLSIFPLIVDKCKKTFEYIDPKSGKCLFKAKAKLAIKGPEIATEQNIAQLQLGAEKAIELVKFAEKNKIDIKEVTSTISAALENVKKKASQVAALEKKTHVVIKKLSDAANNKIKAAIDAYNELRTHAKGYEDRFPEIGKIVSSREKDILELESLASNATADPSNAIDALTELLSKMDPLATQLKGDTEQINHLLASEESFEASKTPQEAPQAEVTETEKKPVPIEDEPLLGDVEQSLTTKINVMAKAGFESVLAKIEAFDSDEVWGDAISAMESYNSELESLVSEGEGIDAELTKELEKFNSMVQKAAGTEESAESIMEEMDKKMEGANMPLEEMVPAYASSKDNLTKKADADKIEVDPKEYWESVKKMQEEFRGQPKKNVVEESRTTLQNWQEFLKPYLPTMGYFTMFSTACEDYVKNTIQPAIVENPDVKVKSQIVDFGQTVREEMLRRMTGEVADPELSSFMRIIEREGKTEESKKNASVADLFSQLVNELKELKTDTSEKLAELFSKNKLIQLFLAQIVKGSKVQISVGLERRPSKAGPVLFDEVMTLMTDMGNSVMKHLDDQVAAAGKDEAKAKAIHSLKNRMLNLDRAIAKAQQDASDESRANVTIELKNLIHSFNESKEKFNVTDMTTQSFVDMLEEILNEAPTATASIEDINNLFVTAEEEARQEIDPKSAAKQAVDGLWPEIASIYHSYKENLDLAMENFIDAAESMEEPSSVEAPSMEPELAFASDNNPNTINRVADTDVSAPCSPNDMYSSYDLSENTLELRDDNGKKKLVINKNLKNLVTKRMNEFLKGAYQKGETVQVDLGDRVTTGTVKQYIGNKEYAIVCDAGICRIHESNLFKI